MINQDILEKYNKIQQLNNLLPIKVSDFYLKKIKEEIKTLGHFDGPLTRIIYPNKEKIELNTGKEHIDWGEDREFMIEGLEGIMVRMYKERVLLLTTENCFSNCQYCFRQDILSKGDVIKGILSDDNITKIINYLNNNREIEEVILSGGDPMTIDTKYLDNIFRRLKTETSIESLRLHTRGIIYNPSIFSKEKISLLSKYNVRLVFHITHPYEICTVVEKKINEISKKGIKLYNQFPLLRGINDHHLVLIKHLKKLDELNIRNLSIYFADPVKYSASYRIPLNRLKKIIQDFNWNTPSWINSTRFLNT